MGPIAGAHLSYFLILSDQTPAGKVRGTLSSEAEAEAVPVDRGDDTTPAEPGVVTEGAGACSFKASCRMYSITAAAIGLSWTSTRKVSPPDLKPAMGSMMISLNFDSSEAKAANVPGLVTPRRRKYLRTTGQLVQIHVGEP